MPADTEMDRNMKLARELRRQATTSDNRRRLQQLPQFRVDQNLPDELRFLLQKLEGEEPATRR